MLPAGTLNGKVAIVTGGGTGLGLAMAREFARLGARLVLTSRKLENLEAAAAEIRAAGSDALAVTCDVRDPDQVARMVDQAVHRWGGVDILVNNAAGNFIVPAERLSVGGWRAVVGIVLDGTFFCTREVGLRMIEEGRGGSILNIVATYAWTGNPGTVHSAAAKAGVLALTRSLAVEWARYGIRVNALAPGPVDTEGAGSRLWASPDERDRLLRSIPVARFGRPEDIACAASYLVSDYASFVNGECLVVDGGQWLSKGMFKYRDEE